MIKVTGMLKKIGKSAFVQELIGWFFYLYVLLVFKTSRWTIENRPLDLEEKGESYFYAFWHGRLLSGTFFYLDQRPKLKGYVLASLHRDGRSIAAAMGHFDITTVDGSSKKGGVGAVLNINRLLKEPTLMAIAPDGRKPGYKMTKGLVSMAKESGRPVFLSAFSVRRGKVLRTWDKFLLPYPFNKGIVLFSEPIYVPADLNAEGVEEWRQKLEKRLLEITIEADERIGLKAKTGLQAKEE